MYKTQKSQEQLFDIIAQAFVNARNLNIPSAEDFEAQSQARVKELEAELEKWSAKVGIDDDLDELVMTKVGEVRSKIEQHDAQDFAQQAAEQSAGAATDWALGLIEAMGLEEVIINKKQRRGRFVVKNDRMQAPDGQEIMGFTSTSDDLGVKTVIASWALPDSHEKRNVGKWLVGHMVDDLFGVEGEVSGITSAGNLVAKAAEVWGVSSAGLNSTPMQSGNSAAGRFLTKEEIAELTFA